MSTGRVFDIRRYALHDGPGIRTTVFFQGCPLSCRWCQNPESRSPLPFRQDTPERCLACGSCEEACPEGAVALTRDGVRTDDGTCRRCWTCVEACPAEAREVVGRTLTVPDVLAELERDRAYYEESGGGITCSGGEPLAQPDFLVELLAACGERGLHRAVDTAGLCDATTLERVAAETDLFLYDVKLLDAARHREWTGVRNEMILANLESLVARGSAVEVRLPLIGGVNDSEAEVDGIGTYLAAKASAVPVRLLPYHALAEDKHRRFDLPWSLEGARVPPERAEQLAARLRAHGLTVTIAGETA